MQLDPGDSFFKAAKISVRAFRRKKFLKETEDRLQKYQALLDTRVLSKLDARGFQQVQEFQQLNQHVKDLVKALADGRDTVQQLLADQTSIFQEHIDRQFEDRARKEARQRVRQEFKKSLFFTEMFARRDNIPRSHEGTCRWMLQPLEHRSRLDADQESDDYQGSDNYQNSDNHQENSEHHGSDDDQRSSESDISATRVPLESNFVDWLKEGGDIYWWVVP